MSPRVLGFGNCFMRVQLSDLHCSNSVHGQNFAIHSRLEIQEPIKQMTPVGKNEVEVIPGSLSTPGTVLTSHIRAIVTSRMTSSELKQMSWSYLLPCGAHICRGGSLNTLRIACQRQSLFKTPQLLTKIESVDSCPTVWTSE